MIRNLLLAAAAIALLGGCATGGYGYHDRGDYHYGRAGVDARYHGAPYGSRYYGYPGYGGFSSYPYGYGGYYGYPYGYGGFGGYGYPYRPYSGFPYHPRPPLIVVPRPDGDPPRHDHRDGRRPPWRDLDNLRRRGGDLEPPRSQPQQLAQPPQPMRPAVRRDDGGSRNEQIMRRARDQVGEREIE